MALKTKQNLQLGKPSKHFEAREFCTYTTTITNNACGNYLRKSSILAINPQLRCRSRNESHGLHAPLRHNQVQERGRVHEHVSSVYNRFAHQTYVTIYISNYTTFCLQTAIGSGACAHPFPTQKHYTIKVARTSSWTNAWTTTSTSAAKMFGVARLL